MKKLLAIVGIFVIITITAVGSGKAEKIFGLPNDYLQFGAGARSLAMGSAFTGVADDASASFWNPAGMARVDEYQLLAMHAPFRMDTSLNFVSILVPFGPWGAVSFSDVLLHSGNFQGRDDLNLVTGENETVMKQTVSAAYAYQINDYVSGGARINFIQERIFSTSGDAFGLDLSLYSKPIYGLSCGLVLNNINRPKITLIEAPDVYGRNTRFGVAYHGKNDLFLIAIDANKLEQQNAYYTAGLEVNPIPLLSLRAGFNQQSAMTTGIGINFGSFTFDYAFSDHDELGDFSKVSLTLRWGNVYEAAIEPLGKNVETGSIFIEGLQNELKFKTSVPSFNVKSWSLTIYDKNKNRVREIKSLAKPPAKIIWDMTDEDGRPVKRDTYYYEFHIAYHHDRSWTTRGSFKLDFTQSNNSITFRMQGDDTLP